MKSLISSGLLILCFSSVFAARPEPQAQIDAFFKTLDSSGPSAAIAEISKGTFLEAQKASQLETLPPKFDATLKAYGKVARIESVDKKFFGESFVRFRLITYHASGAPLFWEFLFFRYKGEWQVYIFRFNDQFKNIFGEAT